MRLVRLALWLSSASALLSPQLAIAEPIACQRAIGRENAKYLDAVSRALQSCEDKRASRKLPIETDCRTEQKTATAIANAGGALRAGIAKRCGGRNQVCNAADTGREADDPLAAIGWDLGACPAGGACGNAVDDCDDIGVCLACSGRALVEQASWLVYGRLDPDEFGGKSPAGKCQRAIGKEAAKYFQARAKILQACWDRRLKGDHTEACPNPGDGKAPALLAKAEATKVRNMCRACGGRDKQCGGADDLAVAAIGFLPSCPAVTVPGGATCASEVADLTDLVACVDCGADFAGACSDLLAVPQFAPLPPACGGRLNAGPVADAGPDQTVPVGTAVALDGSGSSDPEGDPLSYEWSLVTKPASSTAELSDPSAVAPTFTADREGMYVCALVVRDRFVTSEPDTVTVDSRTKQPPIARAGLDQRVAVGQTVRLDGTASSDPDGDPLTYRWTIVDAPAGSGATLDDPFAATPSFVADLPGSYVVELIVDDGTEASAPDQVVISTENVPPVADAGPDVTVDLGDRVVLDGSGSSDADGDPLTFLWRLVDAPAGSTAGLSDPTEVMPTLDVDVAGTYVVELVVNDGTASSDPDTVTITTGNTRPVSDAGPDQAADVGQTVTLDGSGSTDVDGDPLTFRWSLVTGPPGTSATLSDARAVTPAFVVDVEGTYVFQLVVNDGRADSLAETVRVSTEGLPPVADAGPAQSVPVGTTVTLDGSASSDPDGDPITFAWMLTTKPLGSLATLSDPTAVTPIFVVDLPGTYVAQLVVSDGTFSSAPDTVAVSTVDSRPIAFAGSDRVVRPGTKVTLDGTQSRDPDGQPLSYEWKFLVRPTGSAATFSDPADPRPMFVVDRPGAYLIQLVVDDGTQRSQPDTILITTSSRSIDLTLELTTLPTFSTGAGAVVLSEPAEEGGVRVFLSSNNPGIADVPTSVSIEAGETTAAFEVTSFETAGSALITAFTRGWVDDEASLAVVDRETALTLPSAFVGVGRALTGTLTLALPAPAGGAAFTLSTNNENVATIGPPVVVIPEGATSADVTVNGIATGTACFTATAIGYVTSQACVTVTQDLVNLPSGVVVAPGQTLSFPVSVTTPAPAGGVTLTLGSSDPATVAIVPSSVSIAAGETTPAVTPQVTGGALGAAAITGSAPGYAPDTRTVAVKLVLSVTPAPVTLPAGALATLTLSLSAQAPSGGATISLTTDDPAIATIPTPVAIPAGQAVGSTELRGLAEGSTTLRASGPGIDEVTATVTVTPPPAINLAGATVGKNLQEAAGGTLAVPAPAGNLDVTITSMGPGLVLLAPNSATPGSPSIVVQVPAGSSDIPTFFVHGLEAAGTAEIEATAPGYARATAEVTLTPSGFRFASASFTTTPASPDTPVVVAVERLAPGTLDRQTNGAVLRAGFAVDVEVTSSNTAVGTIASPVRFIGPMTSVATQFDPLDVGATTLSIVKPAEFSQPASETEIVATVEAAGIAVSSVTIGKDLQEVSSGTLAVPAPAGNLDVTITSADPTKVLLATTPTALGAGSITVRVAAGSTNLPPFFVHALADAGTVDVSASAPGFVGGTATATLVPSGFVVGPGFVVLESAFETTTLSEPTQIAVWLMPLDPVTRNAPNFYGYRQALRPGRPPVVVEVVSEDPTVGAITVSPVEFGPNEEVETTAFDPIRAGMTTVRVGSPLGFTPPSNLQAVTAAVTAPDLTFSDITVGQDLQEAWAVALEVPAPAGNVNVTITSGDVNRLRLSDSPTVLGGGSLTLTVPAGGGATAVFYAQALGGDGTVTVTASAAGYTGTTATATLVPSGFVVGPGFVVLESAFETTTLSEPTQIAVWLMPLDPVTRNAPNFYGYRQALRPGRPPVVVEVVSEDPTVGAITVSPVEFGPNEEVETTAFDPIRAGMTTVRVGSPLGFTPPSNLQAVTAAVTAPDLTFSDITVGQDLQEAWAVALEVPAPAGNVNVTITSGDVNRLRLSDSPTVLGGGSLTLTVPAGGGATAVFYAQALGGDGTVTVTASAAGYTGTTATATLVPSGFVVGPGFVVLESAFETTTLSEPTQIAVWLMPLDPVTRNAPNFYGYRQALRPGRPPVVVEVVSEDPTVGAITVSPVEFGPNEEVETTAFDPIRAGMTTVRVGSPLGFTPPSNLQAVTAAVTAPDLTFSDITVGQDLQEAWAVALEVPAPAGNVNVTITSGDVNRLRLSDSPTVLGGGSLTLTVPAGGGATAVFYAQALGGDGTVTVTASAAGYTGTTATATLVPSGFVVGPGFVVLESAFETTTLSEPTQIAVWLMPLDPVTRNAPNFYGYRQALRPGRPPVVVEVVSEDPTVGAITVSPVEFGPNEEVETTAFDPIRAGMTTVRVGSPLGFTPPSNLQAVAAAVTAPDLVLNSLTLGKDMQEAATVSLEVPAPPGGLPVTITVADETKARVKELAVIPGTRSLTVVVPAGTSSATFHVEALEGTGTVEYSAFAEGGYDPDTETITLVPSGFVIENLPTSPIEVPLSGADLTLRITPARLDPTFLNFAAVQTLRADMADTQVSITSDDPTVGEITLSPVTFNGVDAPNERVTSFSPRKLGTTTLRVASPGFSPPSDRNNIEVNVVP